MSMFKNIRTNGLLLLVLGSLVIKGAPAQNVQAKPSIGSITESLQYTSAFKNYQPYSEEEIVSWKKANAVVESNGGWKSYAKDNLQPQIEQGKHDHSSNHEMGMKQ